MNTLNIGIATYDEMKARTMAVARGERRISPNEPHIWLTSAAPLGKLLAAYVTYANGTGALIWVPTTPLPHP